MRKLKLTLAAAMLAFSLNGCALLGGMMDGIFGSETTVQDIQESRSAREVHVVVAGMFEAIVKELKLMLEDGTLSLEQGQRIQPMIEVGRTAINASDAFLLQASQQRELGREDLAKNLETEAFDQLRTANSNLDILRSVHLGAVQTAPEPFVSAPPPLLAKPPAGG